MRSSVRTFEISFCACALAFLLAACGGSSVGEGTPGDDGHAGGGNSGAAGGSRSAGGSAGAATSGGAPNDGQSGAGGASGVAGNAGVSGSGGDGGSESGGKSGEGGSAGATSGNGGNGGGVSGNGGANGGASSGSGGATAGTAGAGGSAAGNGGVVNAPSCDPIVFADVKLENVVRNRLAKHTGDITREDVASLTSLDASNAQITSLTGIECLPLDNADISNNPVADLSPLAAVTALQELFAHDLGRKILTSELEALAKLPNLSHLKLDGNSFDSLAPLAQSASLNRLSLEHAVIGEPQSIAELTQLEALELGHTGVQPDVLSGLTKLGYLGLSANQISDITPLAPLHSIFWAQLDNNQISDLSVLSGMPELDTLDLSFNHVKDLSPLSQLMKLGILDFEYNEVTSIAPLVPNSGKTQVESIYAYENPIDCQAEAANIATLDAAFLYPVILGTDCF